MARQNKVRQAEQITVKRSEVHEAPYNPRKITPEASKLIKDNLKRVGLLGGVVWNRTTGNLVSGHQRVAQMDIINKYDPDDPETDYEFRVEVVEMDPKTEKEQNVFMNNGNVQGQFDDNLLREMFADEPDLDFSAMGLDTFDMQILGLSEISTEDLKALDREATGDTPKWKLEQATEDNEEAARFSDETKQSGENTKLDRDKDFYQDSTEQQIARHNEIQKIKDRITAKSSPENDGGMLSYIVLKFSSVASRAHFLEVMAYKDLTLTQLDGDELLHKVEYGDEDE